ncbi:MAG: hypothetical protein AAGI17_05835 [Planctomycetota bacterium]
MTAADTTSLGQGPSAVLAQITRLMPDVTPLPDPPLVQRLLFESPTVPAITLAALGAILLIGLNARGKAMQGLLCLVVAIALAAINIAVASLVTTEREAVTAQTRRVIDATATVDSERLAELLESRVMVTLPVGVPASIPRGREEVIESVERLLGGTYRIESHSIREIQAVIDGTNIARTQVGLIVTAGGSSGIVSWWLIDWRKDGDTWLAADIELISLPIAGVGTKG